VWRYILNGEQIGPVDEQEIRALIAKRKITSETLVWTEGMASWVPAKETPLLSNFASLPPPPPPAKSPGPTPISNGPAVSAKNGKQPFWRRTWVHVLLFIFVPFVQVPLMWYQKKGRLFWRVILSILGFFMTLNLLVPHPPRGDSSYSRSEPEPSTAAEETVAAATPEPTENISWDEIDSIYDLKSQHTDVQKREAWKKFKGKRVRWVGTVTEISDGWTGLTLQIRMDRDTFLSDLIIKLKRSQKSKALALSKGEEIQFSGTLDTWGSILPISLEDGEIE